MIFFWGAVEVFGVYYGRRHIFGGDIRRGILEERFCGVSQGGSVVYHGVGRFYYRGVCIIIGKEIQLHTDEHICVINVFWTITYQVLVQYLRHPSFLL